MSDEDPSVTVAARRLVAENSRWRVYLDRVVDRGGAEVPDYLAVEPKVALAGGITGVCVLPVLADGRVVLVENYRHLFRRSGWEVARGFVEPGESEEAAALREMAEEAGVVADSAERIGAFTPEPSTLRARGAIFIARNCRPGGTRDASEIGLGRAQAFARNEIERMLDAGAIEDAATLIALLWWLKRG